MTAAAAAAAAASLQEAVLESALDAAERGEYAYAVYALHALFASYTDKLAVPLVLRCALVALEPVFENHVQFPAVKYSAPFESLPVFLGRQQLRDALRGRGAASQRHCHWLAHVYAPHSPLKNGAAFVRELTRARESGYALADCWCRWWRVAPYDGPRIARVVTRDSAPQPPPRHVLLHRARGGVYRDASGYHVSFFGVAAPPFELNCFLARMGYTPRPAERRALRDVLVRADVLFAVLWRSPLRALPLDTLQSIVVDAMPYALYSECALGCARARRRLRLQPAAADYGLLAQLQACPPAYRLFPPN